MLYGNYRRASELQSFLQNRVRPLGWVVFGALVLSSIFALDFERGRVGLLTSLLLGCLVVTLIWRTFRTSSLEGSRQLPAQARAGHLHHYSVRLKNASQGRFLRGAWLKDLPLKKLPTLEDFAAAREPGEAERNAFDRTFRYHRWRWLLQQQKRTELFPSIPLPPLSPKETREFSVPLRPLKRGHLPFHHLGVELTDPFGLFQKRKLVPMSEERLLVLPASFALPADVAFDLQNQLAQSDRSTQELGQSDDFAGLREYQPGEPIRHLHWKSWARTGLPVVKEFEKPSHFRLGLLLDLSGAREDPEAFEALISWCATLVEQLPELGFEIICLATSEEELFEADRTPLLEVLALLSPTEKPASSLTDLDFLNAYKTDALLALWQDWPGPGSSLIERLESLGNPVHHLVLSDGATPIEDLPNLTKLQLPPSQGSPPETT